MVGTSVRLETTRSHPLSIKDIEVFGDKDSSKKVDPVGPTVTTRVDLDESSVSASSGAGNPPKNVFRQGQYYRSDKKSVGEWWRVGFKNRSKVDSVRVQSYNMGSSYGHNRLGKVNIKVGD